MVKSNLTAQEVEDKFNAGEDLSDFFTEEIDPVTYTPKKISIKKNFFEQFLNFELNRDDIFQYIEDWHRIDTKDLVSEYLGMTNEQYGLFIRYPEKVESLRTRKID